MFSYQITDVVEAFLHYGSAKSHRRRLREYSDEQIEVLADEFASAHKDMGEEFRPFGGMNWMYGLKAKAFFKKGIKHVDEIRKNPAIKKYFPNEIPDDARLMHWWWTEEESMVQTRDRIFPKVNGTNWWILLITPIVTSFFVFRSWALTGAMILNGIWASESFNALAQYEKAADVCGQSVMTYSWFGMWIALSAAWWKLKFGNFFSWSWGAIAAFVSFLQAVVELGASQYTDPTTFSERNMQHWTTMFNGNMISHTGHLYGFASGLSMTWFLKRYKWI